MFGKKNNPKTIPEQHSGSEYTLPKRKENRGVTSKDDYKVKDVKGWLHLSVKILINGKEIWLWKTFEADGHGPSMMQKVKTEARQIRKTGWNFTVVKY